jgi:hypothetical protein
MGKESLVTKLRDAGYPVLRIVRMGDNDGWRMSLGNGAIIHAFDDGRCIVHGPDAAALRTMLDSELRDGRPCSAGPRQPYHLF